MLMFLCELVGSLMLKLLIINDRTNEKVFDSNVRVQGTVV